MSDPQELGLNDNSSSNVDNLASVTTTTTSATESHTIICETELDDDFFVCRKCNTVFKDLSLYLEHKIQDENYKLSQTRSKINKRIVLPHLVEKKEKKAPVNKNIPTTGTECKNENSVGVKDEVTQDEHNGSGDGGIPSVVKRGRKRKKESEINMGFVELGKDNNCNLCSRKFRRAATLRWHLKYDHKEKGENSDDAFEDDTTFDDELAAQQADGDSDFKPPPLVNHQSKLTTTPDPGLNDHQITAVTLTSSSQSHTVSSVGQSVSVSHEDQKDVEPGSDSTSIVNTTTTTTVVAAPTTTPVDQVETEGYQDRQYECEICGRKFKDLQPFKTHAIVHSNDRKYVCTVEGCPYGFKTKGCLVRHMRRHTGERPFTCEKCGRAFSESGALTRHMKARRNCKQTPDTHYPRYRKKWNYHPNIDAVIDEAQRDLPIADDESDQNENSINELFGDGNNPQTLQVKVEGVEVEVIVNNGISTDYDMKALTLDNNDQKWLVTCNNPADSSSSTNESVVVVKTSKSLTGTTITTVTEVPPSTDAAATTTTTNTTSTATNVPVSSIGASMEMATSLLCRVCGKGFDQTDHLELHLHTHLADTSTPCGLCHFLAHNREEMQLHFLNLHADSLDDIDSTMIGVVFEDSNKTDVQQKDERLALREALQAIKQLHNLKASQDKAEAHQVSGVSPGLTARGSVQCLICHRTFKGVTYLKQHMRMHTGDRPYKCPQCPSRFTSKDVMKKHLLVHTNQRDYKCGECGKLFKRLIHVQQHLKTHSEERAFRCGVCDKLFKTQNSLKVHLRTHTNVNPYRCQVCHRHFRERGSLQRHMRLHTGEKPFVCPHCNRRFAEQGTLSRHLKTKVPCTANRDSTATNLTTSVASLPSNSNSHTVLAQFSSMVADSQYILPSNEQPLTTDNLVILQPGSSVSEGQEIVQVQSIEGIADGATSVEVKDSSNATDILVTADNTDQIFEESEDMETLQVIDPSTGEALIITGDHSVMEMVKNHQVALESTEGGFSLDKLRELLLASGEEGGGGATEVEVETEGVEVQGHHQDHEEEQIVLSESNVQELIMNVGGTEVSVNDEVQIGDTIIITEHEQEHNVVSSSSATACSTSTSTSDLTGVVSVNGSVLYNGGASEIKVVEIDNNNHHQNGNGNVIFNGEGSEIKVVEIDNNNHQIIQKEVDNTDNNDNGNSISSMQVVQVQVEGEVLPEDESSVAVVEGEVLENGLRVTNDTNTTMVIQE